MDPKKPLPTQDELLKDLGGVIAKLAQFPDAHAPTNRAGRKLAAAIDFIKKEWTEPTVEKPAEKPAK